MALSTRLIHRLEGNNDNDEPLAKRLKLAENVLYSSDMLIFRKEDCVFRWLCNEISETNDTEVWRTVHRCLIFDPKNFSRLAIATKTLLIQKLSCAFKNYPDCKVSEEIVQCCSFVFLGTSTQNYTKDDEVVDLTEVYLEFVNKLLNCEHYDESLKIDSIIECAECAVITFSQSCRQSFSEKTNFMVIFIEKLLFPLAAIVENLKIKKLHSKIVPETQKCIKRLLIGSVRNILLPEDESKKLTEAEVLFKTLKSKVSSMKIVDIKVAFSYLFQSVVSIFQQNSLLIDTILRKLVDCINHKEQSKQVLTVLIDNSTDVSYNFDNEIDSVSLKTFLKKFIEEVIAKKKNLKCSDYEFLSAVSKLNPLIVEDLTQNILERILFEKKKNESEKLAQELLVKELWKSSVRLRRHHKFLSKFLLTINCSKVEEAEGSDLISKFELPKVFMVEFKEDLKSKTTSAQIMAMFLTLIYHLKSDCINNLSNSLVSAHQNLMIKVVTSLFVAFFESCNFLDNSLPRDWLVKFYSAFSDLRNSLSIFAKKLCSSYDNFQIEVFTSFSDIVKMWCEMYGLLQYYLSKDIALNLNFPVEEMHFNELKNIVKKCKMPDSKAALNQLLLYKMFIYNKENQEPIKDKMIKQVWSIILENHFEIIEFLNENQLLEFTSYLVQDARNSQEKLNKWTLLLKQNFSRITKKFATALVFQVITNFADDVGFSTSKIIAEKIDFSSVLQSVEDSDSLKNALKKANKEFSKQNFKSLQTVNIDEICRNLMFLSDLPLSQLNTEVRAFLFLVLYNLEHEIKNSHDVKEFFTNLYLDLLRPIDINIIDYVTQPTVLINHFKDNHRVLLKICKLSLNHLTTLEFWEKFITTEDCNRKMSSTLIICIDGFKSAASSNEHETALHNLSLKLSSKIKKELEDNVNDPDEIAGLRISLKLILAEKKKLKDNLKNRVELIIKNALEEKKNVCHDQLTQEVMRLSVIALSNRENFSVNEETVKKLCNAFIQNFDGNFFTLFLEILTDNEFVYFSKSLVSHTKNVLITGNAQALEKLIVIWESLSKADAKPLRTKSLKISMDTYFHELLSSEINQESSVHLLKICRTIVRSKKMIKLADNIIDFIIVASMQCLDKSIDNHFQSCQETLGLCLDFLRLKSEITSDRLFAIMSLFCKIVEITLQEGKKCEFSDEQILRILAVDIEKFCTFFAKLKKNVARISSYLIADLIDISSRTGVLPNYLKISIESSISHLLGNCDQYAISFLSRTLPVSIQQVFKTMYDNYKRYNKFTGKI